MYNVYVLKSLIKNWHYVGMTENIKQRVKEHNNGKTRSTKAYRPFKLIYTKQFSTRMQARDFEKYLKIRSNKEKIIAEVAELVDA